MNINIVIIF